MKVQLTEEGEVLLRRLFPESEVSRVKNILEELGDVDAETALVINESLNEFVSIQKEARAERRQNIFMWGALALGIVGISLL